MEEIWKDVIDYEGLYQVSSIGRVKSLNYLRSGKERILKNGKDSDGYMILILSKRLIRKTGRVHQLVAESFIDKDYKSKGLVVNHKNFKRDDNRLENLELTTQRENNNKKHLPSSSKYTGVSWQKRLKKWKCTISISGKNKYLGVFDNEKEASDYYEAALICVNEGRVDDILDKKRSITSKHKGVHFDKIQNRWKSTFKQKHIGSFKTEEDAYQAYLDYKEKSIQF
jgi:hypothetical protein